LHFVFVRFGFKTNNSDTMAVLILTPDHYDRTGKNKLSSVSDVLVYNVPEPDQAASAYCHAY
jgi:hypothetical protein